MSEYLNDGEVAVLNAARAVLNAMHERAGFGSGSIPHAELKNTDIFFRGELRHSMKVAEDAIFDVLNQANSSRFAVLTYEQLHMHPEPTYEGAES